jgi:hypothetical protein
LRKTGFGILICAFGFSIGLLICGPTTVQADVPAKTLYLAPPESPIKSHTGDIDMNQFDNISSPNLVRKGGPMRANATCQTEDGRVLKSSDAGFKQCIEGNQSQIRSNPNPPEARPYDPRTN